MSQGSSSHVSPPSVNAGTARNPHRQRQDGLLSSVLATSTPSIRQVAWTLRARWRFAAGPTEELEVEDDEEEAVFRLVPLLALASFCVLSSSLECVLEGGRWILFGTGEVDSGSPPTFLVSRSHALASTGVLYCVELAGLVSFFMSSIANYLLAPLTSCKSHGSSCH